MGFYTATLCFIQLLIILGSSDQITKKFEDELSNFVNAALGIQKFQNYLDESVEFSTSPLDVVQVLNEVTSAMETEYQDKVFLLNDLAQNMQEKYTNFEVDSELLYGECCTEDGSEYTTWDEQLNQYVKDDICVTGRGLRTNPQEIIPRSVIDKWRQVFENEHNDGMQWIYYGTEEGVMFNYPAVQMCIEKYDPRNRPFYIETVTPIPKDIVIVVDRSGSMGETNNGQTLMNIAHDAAKTVIDTLNVNDRVGVVAFSTVAEIPPGESDTSDCYARTVAKATPENKFYLKKFVDGIRTEVTPHRTNYVAGLTAAFGLLKNVPDIKFDKRKRSKVILFLTDGKPDDDGYPSDPNQPGHEFKTGGYIYQKISEMNAEINNSAIILTYGLGGFIDDKAKEILTNISNQVISEDVGEVTKGRFVHVSEPSNLRREMTSYYNLFTTSGGSSEVHFTVPYQDAFGSGIIASICASVNEGSTLKGVICIDQTIEKLLSEIMYRRSAESSYFFMVDIYSRVLDHPYIQNPTEITDHPRYTFLNTLELGDRIDEMILSIVDGGSGNLTTTTRRIISRGDAIQDGVDYNAAETHYQWKAVPGTKYVVGVVTIASGGQASITWEEELPSHFVYHKFREQANLPEQCIHDHAVVLKDETGIQFTLRAFRHPYQFLVRTEDKSLVNSFAEYFTNWQAESVSIAFKDQVREYVAATAYFQDIMLETSDDFHDYILWRYLATEHGIFRMFPASEMPKTYDSTMRLWYRQAMANRENVIVTKPYDDGGGLGSIITIAKVLFEGRDAHTSEEDTVIGVMGMDMYPIYLHKMLMMFVPECHIAENSCFLMDTSGFIITHPDWTHSRVTESNNTIHVAKKEPGIARRLINANLLQPRTCVNVIAIRNQYSWVTNIHDSISNNDFEVHPVEETNMFLVIKKSNSFGAECFNCNIKGYSYCRNQMSVSDCFCPCYDSKQENYKYCEDSFDFKSDDMPICAAPLLSLDTRTSQTTTIEPLEPCFTSDCTTYESELTCKLNDACIWTSECLTKDRCNEEHLAPGEELPRDCIATKKGTSSSDASLPGWAIALIVILLLVSIVVIGIILFSIMRYNHLNKQSGPVPDNVSIYDEMPDIDQSKVHLPQTYIHPINQTAVPNLGFDQPDLTKEALNGHGSEKGEYDSSGYLSCFYTSANDVAANSVQLQSISEVDNVRQQAVQNSDMLPNTTGHVRSDNRSDYLTLQSIRPPARIPDSTTSDTLLSDTIISQPEATQIHTDNNQNHNSSTASLDQLYLSIGHQTMGATDSIQSTGEFNTANVEAARYLASTQISMSGDQQEPKVQNSETFI